MKLAALMGMSLLCALAPWAAAQNFEPVVHQPGIKVAPFAGLAAGTAPLFNPVGGFIELPGGPHGGMLMLSELGGNDLVHVDGTGRVWPYTSLFGPFPSGSFGVDQDAPLANLPFPTLGAFGGPATVLAGQIGPVPMPLISVRPGGGWGPALVVPATPGAWHLEFDRTPGFAYGGVLHASDWGGDGSDGIFFLSPAGGAALWAPLPGVDPRYFTFDASGGATGYGPAGLWVSSFATGAVFSIMPGGAVTPPLAVLTPGAAGLAFGPGGAHFGTGLYVGNMIQGMIDIVMPGGQVLPFASGLPCAAYPMFVTIGPYAVRGRPTLYVADCASGTVWMFTPCAADLNDDTLVDFADYLEFLNLYDAGDLRVDYTGDGLVDFSDYLEFLNSYNAGC
ncbi:MAG: hypothetical protein IT436_11635 [Phycisphaerales bacterium]|nr:hypothetical protein [Phycisphaerales bacterium]